MPISHGGLTREVVYREALILEAMVEARREDLIEKGVEFRAVRCGRREDRRDQGNRNTDAGQASDTFHQRLAGELVLSGVCTLTHDNGDVQRGSVAKFQSTRFKADQ